MERRRIKLFRHFAAANIIATMGKSMRMGLNIRTLCSAAIACGLALQLATPAMAQVTEGPSGSQGVKAKISAAYAGPYALHEAVRHNDLPAVARLLNAGASPNQRDGEGFTPLMIASGWSEPQMVELLLTAGADVNMLDPRMGASALHKAAQGGSVEVGNLLLIHGAFIDLQSPTLGHTALIDATWHKNAKFVQFLLDRGAKTSLKTHAGATALDFAKRDGLTHIIHLIEAHDAEIAAIQQRQTLMAAVKRGDAEGVKQLIAAGADVNEPAPMAGTFDDGYTPLAVAARDGHAEITQLLLDAGADPRLIDGLIKATPGHKAGYMGHADVMRILLAHRAAHPGSVEVLEIDAQGPYNGMTALHDAIWHGHTETAELLIQAGARTDLRAHYGQTPLELAQRYGYRDIVRLLTENSAPH